MGAPRRIDRTAAAVAPLLAVAAAIALSGAAGCASTHRNSAGRRVELAVPTTLPATPCDVLGAAERTVSNASLTATRADARAKADVTAALDRLRAAVPAGLGDDVDAIADAFHTLWSAPTASGADPFETDRYLRADQAIRREVLARCPGLGSSTTIAPNPGG